MSFLYLTPPDKTTGSQTINALNQAITIEAGQGQGDWTAWLVGTSFVGTLVAETSADNTNWAPARFRQSAPGLFSANNIKNLSGFTKFNGIVGSSRFVRVRISAYTSGSI